MVWGFAEEAELVGVFLFWGQELRSAGVSFLSLDCLFEREIQSFGFG